MPPTRGHDLKLVPGDITVKKGALDAPHTGARLETYYESYQDQLGLDAPHTGARLETRAIPLSHTTTPRCPPHGGTT